uniref:Uncharacterized protein LOC110218636 n=1 Tax=Phascolarctos cinereus TaxID=38626 RepID=A0A6P5LFF0_PHACI|nr:uncharacterized protein LOC110218636 [Phascolarctos cinereus]
MPGKYTVKQAPAGANAGRTRARAGGSLSGPTRGTRPAVALAELSRSRFVQLRGPRDAEPEGGQTPTPEKGRARRGAGRRAHSAGRRPEDKRGRRGLARRGGGRRSSSSRAQPSPAQPGPGAASARRCRSTQVQRAGGGRGAGWPRSFQPRSRSRSRAGLWNAEHLGRCPGAGGRLGKKLSSGFSSPPGSCCRAPGPGRAGVCVAAAAAAALRQASAFSQEPPGPRLIEAVDGIELGRIPVLGYISRCFLKTSTEVVFKVSEP